RRVGRAYRVRRRFGGVFLRTFVAAETPGADGAPVFPRLLQRLPPVFSDHRGRVRGRVRDGAAGVARGVGSGGTHHGPGAHSPVSTAGAVETVRGQPKAHGTQSVGLGLCALAEWGVTSPASCR